MANRFENTFVWEFSAITGGTDDCLDYAGSVVDGNNPAIAVGHRAFVTVSLGNTYCVIEYEVFSSGATASGNDIISPVAGALTNAGDNDLRWHRTGPIYQNGTVEPTSPITGLVFDLVT